MNKYYVYKHFKKDNGEIFYVGKGMKKRAYSKQNRNRYWHNIVNKHGYDVEIIKDNLTEEEALNLESKLILKLKQEDLCKANLSDGNGPTGYHWTKKQRNKLSKSKQGTTLSKSHRENIGKSIRGKNNGFYGRKHTKEFKDMIAKQNSKLNSGSKNPAARKVKYLKTGRIYNCMKDAAKDLSISWLTVSRHCRGIVQTCNFEYVGEK